MERVRPKIHQIDGLQILRCVAVILVAWLHAGQQISHNAWSIDFGVFGIDIFFVISGFILSLLVLREKRPAGLAMSRHFLIRRAIRIYPLYWIFAGIVALRMLVGRVHIPLEILLSVPLLPFPSPLFLGVAWTLRFEVLFYLVMGVVIFFTIRRALEVLLAVMLLLGVSGTFFHPGPALIVVCNPILLEFAFGIVIAMVYARFGRRRRSGRVMLLAGSLLALYLAIYPPAGAAQSAQMVMADAGVLQRVMTWGVAAWLIVGGMVLWSPGTEGRVGKVLVGAGSASYSSYLVSGMVIEFAVRTIVRLFRPALQAWPGLLMDQCLVTLAVLVAGWISYRVLEKPMLDWMHRRLV